MRETMKKILIILLAGILLAACSDDGGNGKNNDQGSDGASTGDENKAEEKEASKDKKVYQIGETAVITSDMYEFDYEVTVNDFELTKEVDGTKIGDYISGAVEEARFAVIDVSIKNISDEAYVPNEMFSANFAGSQDRGGDTMIDQFFTEGDKELGPGEELNGHLVYTTRMNYADTFILKYEFTSDEETHFELPNPEG